MTVTLLAPDGNKYQVEWEKLLEFSKQACELWILESEENKQEFLRFKANYQLFLPYYDFLLGHLHYIQIGFPFKEHLYGISKGSHIDIYPLEEHDRIEYNYLKGKDAAPYFHISHGNDDLLDYQKHLVKYKQGFLFADGSFISIQTLGSHQSIAYTYLLEQMIENPSLLKTYLYYKDKIVDIREFFYYILGCAEIAGSDVKIGIYDESMMTEIQKQILETIDFDPAIQDSILEEFKNPFKEQEVTR